MNINLLTPREGHPQRSMALLLTITAIAITYAILIGCFLMLQQKIERAHAQLANNKMHIMQLQTAQKHASSKQLRIYQQQRDNLIATLSTIANTIPENMQLRQLEKHNDTLLLNGNSLSMPSITAFIKNLNSSPTLQNVQLKDVLNDQHKMLFTATALLPKVGPNVHG